MTEVSGKDCHLETDFFPAIFLKEKLKFVNFKLFLPKNSLKDILKIKTVLLFTSVLLKIIGLDLQSILITGGCLTTLTYCKTTENLQDLNSRIQNKCIECNLKNQLNKLP